ncbi:Gfo/Idh/MocA family protein [Agromyces archimandritae]|uniref:Gfo/Idh/MocA family oxidoreductase n=1 Tax=Agromyces archimandritae TaxID=2781962 RepID=A0A975FJN5_9MICO|nr:Gfo/Idh/MocA family oxidoreductase [Agromyces archimandritae]QTX03735.1 Gfo/Idh/MocA family oxidoreductase [Agromyces archimandritae]
MSAGLPRIGVAGIHGHGANHVRAARSLESAGRARLAAVADPLAGATPVPGAARFADAAEMIERAELDIVVLSTPIHTHLPLALTALARGRHVLLEKPPTATLADFERLTAAAEAAGRSVQTGFQSLGSQAIGAVRELIAGGAIGTVTRYGALGTWLRTEAYWARSAWAGRRSLGGVPVVDGAVTNPLAHAIATAFAIAGARTVDDVSGVRLDLYRANAIEADDTSSLVVGLAGRAPLTAALSLTAPRRSEPYIVVHGEAGRIVLWYTLDTVQFDGPGTAPVTSVHPRTGLLDNLVDHVSNGAALVAPLEDAGAFMRVLEAVRTGTDPRPIAAPYARRIDSPDGPHLVVDGIEHWSRRAVAEGRTFAELGAPWAVAEPR